MSMKGYNGPSLVYQAIGLINGKRYVGVTVGTDAKALKRRAYHHKSNSKTNKSGGIFGKAIKKYGFEMFRFSILLTTETYYEALAEEVRLIALLKPEYNVTRGGEGFLGYNPSPEARKKLSESNIGRPGHWAAKKLPKSTVEASKKLAARPDRVEAWKAFRALGPKATRYVIRCLDDDKEYNGLSAAGRAYGLSRNSIKDACDGKKPYCNGLRFEYGQKIEIIIRPQRKQRSKPIICLDDGLIYSTAAAAAEIYGLDSGQILAVCQKKQNRLCAGDLVFRYANEPHGGKSEADEIRKQRLESRRTSAVIARSRREKTE